MKTGAKGQRFSHEVCMCFPETHDVLRRATTCHDVSRLRSLPGWRCPAWWSCCSKALQLLCLLGNRCLHLATAPTCIHMHPHAPTCTHCIHCNQCHTKQHKTSEDHPRNVAHHQTAYLFASSTAQALVIQAQRTCSRRSCFAKHVTNRTKCSEAVCGTLVHTWNENIAKKRMPNKI